MFDCLVHDEREIHAHTRTHTLRFVSSPVLDVCGGKLLFQLGNAVTKAQGDTTSHPRPHVSYLYRLCSFSLFKLCVYVCACVRMHVFSSR